MLAKDVKHGMKVSLDGDIWEVLDKSPHNKSGTNPSWWLHKYSDAGEWQTCYARVDSMKEIGIGPRRTPEMLETAIYELEMSR